MPPLPSPAPLVLQTVTCGCSDASPRDPSSASSASVSSVAEGSFPSLRSSAPVSGSPSKPQAWEDSAESSPGLSAQLASLLSSPHPPLLRWCWALCLSGPDARSTRNRTSFKGDYPTGLHGSLPDTPPKGRPVQDAGETVNDPAPVLGIP